MDYASHALLPSLGLPRSDIFARVPAGRSFRSVAAQNTGQNVARHRHKSENPDALALARVRIVARLYNRCRALR